MRKQIRRKLIAGLLAAVMMIASVPETVYAVEQALHSIRTMILIEVARCTSK